MLLVVRQLHLSHVLHNGCHAFLLKQLKELDTFLASGLNTLRLVPFHIGFPLTLIRGVSTVPQGSTKGEMRRETKRGETTERERGITRTAPQKTAYPSALPPACFCSNHRCKCQGCVILKVSAVIFCGWFRQPCAAMAVVTTGAG
jgi:hypothetical protein